MKYDSMCQFGSFVFFNINGVHHTDTVYMYIRHRNGTGVSVSILAGILYKKNFLLDGQTRLAESFESQLVNCLVPGWPLLKP